MQERQVTVDGVSYPLPDPFFVLATQNPVELEGTFPLPEAQLDRFLLQRPDRLPERGTTRSASSRARAERRACRPRAAARSRRTWRRCASRSTRFGSKRPVRAYIVAIARATREHPDLRVGASPRAIEHMGDAVPGAGAAGGPGLRAARRRQGAGRAGARPPAGAHHRRADPRPRRRGAPWPRSWSASRSRPSSRAPDVPIALPRRRERERSGGAAPSRRRGTAARRLFLALVLLAVARAAGRGRSRRGRPAPRRWRASALWARAAWRGVRSTSAFARRGCSPASPSSCVVRIDERQTAAAAGRPHLRAAAPRA